MVTRIPASQRTREELSALIEVSQLIEVGIYFFGFTAALDCAAGFSTCHRHRPVHAPQP
jgi:hypothetical protein